MLTRVVTNQLLANVLADLGFQMGNQVPPNCVVWRHPDSNCSLVLPANKLLERARPADVVGVETQLRFHGHLDAADFESLLAAASGV